MRQEVEEMKEQGMTETPDGWVENSKLPANYGLPDCECKHCFITNLIGKQTLNHGAHKQRQDLADNEFNRWSMSGDADYKTGELKI